MKFLLPSLAVLVGGLFGYQGRPVSRAQPASPYAVLVRADVPAKPDKPLASGPVLNSPAKPPVAAPKPPAKAAPKRVGATIVVPGEVKVKPGRLARIVLTTDGANLKYVNVYENVDMFREYDPTAYAFQFLVQEPGRYRIGFVIDGPAEPAYCTVVVGEPVPPGPDPGPGPGPSPSDPLAKDLQTLYISDASPDKAKHKASLAALYRQSPTIVNDVAVATIGDLYGTMSRARQALMPADAILSLRQRIAQELDTLLPKKVDAPLTPDIRATANKAFARVALCLEAVK